MAVKKTIVHILNTVKNVVISDITIQNNKKHLEYKKSKSQLKKTLFSNKLLQFSTICPNCKENNRNI